MPMSLIVIVSNYNTAAIEVSSMITHRPHSFSPACLPNICRFHFAMNFHTLNSMTIDGELSMLLEEVLILLDTHGVHIVLPTPGPCVASTSVHQRAIVIGTTRIKEHIFHLLLVNLSTTSDMARV